MYYIEEPNSIGDHPASLQKKDILNTKNMFKKCEVRVTSQASINRMWKNKMREDTCKAIALCIYNNFIIFNVTNNKEWNKMFELVNMVQDLNHHPIMRLKGKFM